MKHLLLSFFFLWLLIITLKDLNESIEKLEKLKSDTTRIDSIKIIKQ